MSKLNIYQKINAIMEDVSYVQKEDKKVNNQYKFVSHDAVTSKIRPAFQKHGVIAIPDFFDITQDGNRTACKMKMTFINMDSPDDKLIIDCAGFGQGIDPQDKGPGKAMSYAYKYALLKMFALETGDDPEKDNIDYMPQKQLKKNTPTADEKRIAAEDWANNYLIQLDSCMDLSDLMDLERDSENFLKKIKENYPDLSKKIDDATKGRELIA